MPEQQHIQIEVVEVGDVAVVYFSKSKIICDDEITRLGQELLHLVETENRTKLLLSFSNVEFLSAAALGKLITLDKKIKNRQGSLKMCDMSHQIYELFKITHLCNLFDIRASESDALAAFGA